MDFQKELCDFLIIWAVGSILGTTKNVDMVFTRKHEICRLQVLVLDPNLIPQFVEVVIGESLYTLQFRVEENVEDNEPKPMDMDDYKDGGYEKEEEADCDRTTSKMRGFISQDHIGGFSTKRECANTHK
jgi:hypothetical protein